MAAALLWFNPVPPDSPVPLHFLVCHSLWSPCRSTVGAGNRPWGGLTTPSNGYFTVLQGTGKYIEQTLVGLKPGQQYSITFLTTHRPGYGDDEKLTVKVNGAVVLNVGHPAATFCEYTCTFNAKTATAVLRFENDSGAGDRSIFLDNVRISVGDNTAARSACSQPKVITRSPTVAPTAASAGPVTCKMTVDNTLLSVFYNNVDVTPTLKGNAKNWQAPKTFSFTPVAGAVLAISGSEAGNCNGCQCSGLVLDCTARNGSGWDGLTSGHSWMTQGYDNSASYPTGWQANAFDDSKWGAPCTSSSRFSLGGSSEKKIWPTNGKKFAAFRLMPWPVSCRLTIDNTVVSWEDQRNLGML